MSRQYNVVKLVCTIWIQKSLMFCLEHPDMGEEVLKANPAHLVKACKAIHTVSLEDTDLRRLKLNSMRKYIADIRVSNSQNVLAAELFQTLSAFLLPIMGTDLLKMLVIGMVQDIIDGNITVQSALVPAYDNVFNDITTKEVVMLRRKK